MSANNTALLRIVFRTIYIIEFKFKTSIVNSLDDEVHSKQPYDNATSPIFFILMIMYQNNKYTTTPTVFCIVYFHNLLTNNSFPKVPCSVTDSQI